MNIQLDKIPPLTDHQNLLGSPTSKFATAFRRRTVFNHDMFNRIQINMKKLPRNKRLAIKNEMAKAGFQINLKNGINLVTTKSKEGKKKHAFDQKHRADTTIGLDWLEDHFMDI